MRVAALPCLNVCVYVCIYACAHTCSTTNRLLIRVTCGDLHQHIYNCCFLYPMTENSFCCCCVCLFLALSAWLNFQWALQCHHFQVAMICISELITNQIYMFYISGFTLSSCSFLAISVPSNSPGDHHRSLFICTEPIGIWVPVCVYGSLKPLMATETLLFNPVTSTNPFHQSMTDLIALIASRYK